MKRYIRLNENNIVVTVRYGTEIVEGEIESELGEANEIRLEDGTFAVPELGEGEPDGLEERIKSLEAVIDALLGEEQ